MVSRLQQFKVNRMKYVMVLFFLVGSCTPKNNYEWKPLHVRATAYNSVPSQTDDEPLIGAWGDTLSPKVNSIAVSRDLIALGLKHNTKVMIEGLTGVYLVKDKMAARWTKSIDIHMGAEVKKAREWGVKRLSIVYAVSKDSLTQEIDQ